MARSPIYLEVKDSAGNVVPSPTVNIKDRVTGTNATLYVAETGVTTMSNPATGDSLGRLLAWVDRGVYNCFISGTGISAYTVPVDTTSDATLSLPGVPLQIGDTGLSGQIRAGRDFVVADVTTLLGLSTPVGLFNLGSLTNLGSGGNLVNKGTVTFATGINGAASSAAQFSGSTAQALYIADIGGADPYRTKTVSAWCWFRTDKRGVVQMLMSKGGPTSNLRAWHLQMNTTGTLQMGVSLDGTNTAGSYLTVDGTTNMDDGRWHFALGVYDGSAIKIFVDGNLENYAALGGQIFASSGPFNIGGQQADATTASGIANYGRIDEAGVIADIVSDDQARLLYAAKLAHSYGRQPARAYLGVRRGRRSSTLATSDFPATPARLYNFTNGALTDAGSNNTPVTVTGTGSIVPCPGVDGSKDSAYSFFGTHTGLAGVDTGLPSGTASRSVGCWFKCSLLNATGSLVSWGTAAGNALAELAVNTSGQVVAQDNFALSSPSGWSVDDGRWHHVVGVWDLAPVEGVARKLYLDGEMVTSTTTANGTVTLTGATTFRIGAKANAFSPFVGQIDLPFVYAGALSAEAVAALYAKAGPALDASPRDPSDYIEAMDGTYVYTVFDMLDSCSKIDLSVSS